MSNERFSALLCRMDPEIIYLSSAVGYLLSNFTYLVCGKSIFSEIKADSLYPDMMMKTPIYLDYQSTTPTDSRVLDSMLPYFTEFFANPSSSHKAGIKIQEAVEKARINIISKFNGKEGGLIFTGCATEAINFAFSSLSKIENTPTRPHIITQNTEHKAVLECCIELETRGFEVTYLPVDDFGLIHPDQVLKAIKNETVLVAIMHGNNEIGVIQPIESIGKICNEKNILFLTDAAQTAGKINIDVKKSGIDFLVISGHKMYGPKGIAALYASAKGIRNLYPLFLGGGQEDNLRSGTLNVPGIIGLNTALHLSLEKVEYENNRLQKLRDNFYFILQQSCGGIHINGHLNNRLAGNLNILIENVPGNILLKQISKDLSVSTASACLNALSRTSYVLKAIGLTEEQVSNSIRISFGRFTTPEQVDWATKIFVKNIQRIRKTRA